MSHSFVPPFVFLVTNKHFSSLSLGLCLCSCSLPHPRPHSKNEQEKIKVNEQERREEDGDGDIIMIEGGEADSEEESKEEGKSDGLVTVKIPLEGGEIEEMSFSMNEEAWVAGGLPNPIWVEVGNERIKKTVPNLKNNKYELPNKKLQQVLIETVKFIASNIAKFKKRLRQLSVEETGEIINKDREKVRQSKKKLKGNTDKMLEIKKSNTISKTILTGKEKSGGVRNFRSVPSPSSSTSVLFPSLSTGVPSPSLSTGVPSFSSSTGVQNVPLSKSIHY